MKENVSLNRLIWCEDEKTLEKYNKYVSDIAKKIIEELSDNDRKELLKDSNYINHHFGFGMYIRNNYIYEKIDIKIDADEMSADIFYEILKQLK